MSTSLVTQRVVHNTVDISVAVSDFRASTYALTYVAGQYIYIGTSTPFNNLWVELSTVASASVGAPTIEIWWGQAWHAAVDVIDQTSGLTVSGRYSWAVDNLKGWDTEQYSTTVGLSSTHIYDKYWCRLSWAGNFSATLSYLGQKFSNDAALESYYPDLLQANILEGFKSGKTTWNDQHFMAADIIIKDLRKREIIYDRGQLFDWQAFEEASCHKVAEIAYSAFGTPYIEHMNRSRKRYEEELNRKYVNLDTNKDGRLSTLEKQDTQGWMTR